MKVHDLLTPLTATAARRLAATGGNWMRELEQAQTWNWFHGALSAPCGGATVRSGRQAVAATSSNRGLRASSGEPRAVPQGSSGLPHARSGQVALIPSAQVTFEAAMVAVPRQAPAVAWSMTDAPLRFHEHSPEASQEAPPPECDPSLQRASHADVRVHVETTQEGVALWFGIDGDPDLVAVRASALLSELRRDLASTGQRVAALVCNGKSMDPFNSNRSKELP
jgi:hypothetical protein